jgi:chromosome segregation ATPase
VDWTQIIVALISGVLGAGIGATAINAFANRKIAAAEAVLKTAEARAKHSESESHEQETLVGIAQSLVQVYRDEVKGLRCRLDEFEKQIKGRDMRITELELENKDLREEVRLLKRQNANLVCENREFAKRITELEKRLGDVPPANDGKS